MIILFCSCRLDAAQIDETRDGAGCYLSAFEHHLNKRLTCLSAKSWCVLRATCTLKKESANVISAVLSQHHTTIIASALILCSVENV